VFYVIARFFVDEWRAVVVMSVFQSILIEGLVCGVALAMGHTPLLIPKLTLAVGAPDRLRDNSTRASAKAAPI